MSPVHRTDQSDLPLSMCGSCEECGEAQIIYKQILKCRDADKTRDRYVVMAEEYHVEIMRIMPLFAFASMSPVSACLIRRVG